MDGGDGYGITVGAVNRVCVERGASLTDKYGWMGEDEIEITVGWGPE